MSLARCFAQQLIKLPSNRLIDGIAKRLVTLDTTREPMWSRFKYWIVVGGDNSSVSSIRADVVLRRYEPGYLSLTARMLRQGDVAIDVGAYEGYVSLLLAQKVGGGMVFAVEPHPANVTVLQENIRLNHLKNGITVVSKAISNRSGTMLLHGDGAWGTLISSIYPSTMTIPVEVDTLDNIFEGNSLMERLSLIKIDVEGSEIFAVQGARRLILARRPIVSFEVNLSLLAYVEVSLQKLFDLFLQNDYQLFVEQRGMLSPFKWLSERVSNFVAVPRARLAEKSIKAMVVTE